MKNNKFTMNIGIISFIVVFIILCLMTFSILSLVSAQSNLDMTNRILEHTSEYYQLSSQGEETLKQIDQYLYKIYKEYPKADYFDKIKPLKEMIPNMTIKDHHIQYDIKGKNQYLHIEIEILYPGNQLYQLKSWIIQPNDQWQADEKMEIL